MGFGRAMSPGLGKTGEGGGGEERDYNRDAGYYPRPEVWSLSLSVYEEVS
jgi:hypothetical protein